MINKIILCLAFFIICTCYFPHSFDPNKEFVDLSYIKIQYKIVSMTKSLERRNLIQKQLNIIEDTLDNNSIGSRKTIDWNWLDAIDGSNTNPYIVKTKQENKVTGNLRPGEIGILLTTIDKIYPTASSFDGISVFLEDDLIIRADLDLQLRNALRRVPDDWDILYLGCNLNYWVDSSGKVRTHYYDAEYLNDNGFKKRICSDDDVYPIKGTAWHEITNQCMTGGWAYALNNNSADKLTSILTKNRPYDRAAIDMQILPLFGYEIKAYCLNPELVHHRDDLQSSLR
jgi:hypothetical protein